MTGEITRRALLEPTTEKFGRMKRLTRVMGAWVLGCLHGANRLKLFSDVTQVRSGSTGGEVIRVEREEEMVVIRARRDCTNHFLRWSGEPIFADETPFLVMTNARVESHGWSLTAAPQAKSAPRALANLTASTPECATHSPHWPQGVKLPRFFDHFDLRCTVSRSGVCRNWHTTLRRHRGLQREIVHVHGE